MKCAINLMIFFIKQEILENKKGKAFHRKRTIRVILKNKKK